MYKKIIIKDLGLTHWKTTFLAMHEFIKNSSSQSIDEIWFLEHYSIFTHGQVKNHDNIINLNNIPLEYSDRGGRITYHAPGQQIVYFLINIKRRNIYPRCLITLLEKLIINTLKYFSIIGYTINNYPGVYVDNKKICSIGLRIKNGYSLHGLALNVNLDLLPFNYIYPCGNQNIKMTMMADYVSNITMHQVKTVLLKQNFF
ncbi:Octanoyltransferase [Buchnera aphidicola (Eriosoma grossulariae)]|uniref:lipoyl(octanoyl) transferase LipB n=1 Tax=Buchnera aphidicola TaxID=9 RepID=UPI003463EF96